jgi:hypothetical protein
MELNEGRPEDPELSTSCDAHRAQAQALFDSIELHDGARSLARTLFETDSPSAVVEAEPPPGTWRARRKTVRPKSSRGKSGCTSAQNRRPKSAYPRMSVVRCTGAKAAASKKSTWSRGPARMSAHLSAVTATRPAPLPGRSGVLYAGARASLEWRKSLAELRSLACQDFPRTTTPESGRRRAGLVHHVRFYGQTRGTRYKTVHEKCGANSKANQKDIESQDILTALDGVPLDPAPAPSTWPIESRATVVVARGAFVQRDESAGDGRSRVGILGVPARTTARKQRVPSMKEHYRAEQQRRELRTARRGAAGSSPRTAARRGATRLRNRGFWHVKAQTEPVSLQQLG